MFRTRVLRYRLRIPRFYSRENKLARRCVSSSSLRHAPVLDWVFGSKTVVPSAKKVPSSQEIHGFDLKDDFAWMNDGNSSVSTYTTLFEVKYFLLDY